MPTLEFPARDRSKVQSVERSLDLLEVLSACPQGLGIVDLSHRVGLHTSTTHRLLATLLARGYVRQDPQSGHYAIGLRVLQLANATEEQSDIRTLARPFLQKLVQITRETANLVTLDGMEAVYVDQVPSPQLVRMFAATGRRVPLHSTGCGKLFLAHMLPEDQARVIKERGLPRFTRYTLITTSSLDRELADIRKRGYAVDNQEHNEGVRCIAAPIRDHTGDVIAAISISGPTTRVTRERVSALSKQVLSVAAEISGAAGYRH